MTIIIALIMLAVLILAHEWGHFIVARLIGIPVHEFSLGFGRKLYSTHKNGVEYSLRLIPMGGFVRMAGEEPGDMQDPDGYNKRRPLEKMGVAFSGPFMNFVLAIFIFIYTFAFIGIPQPMHEAVVGELVQGKPAVTAGLQTGDRIVKVNDTAIASWDQFVGLVQTSEVGSNLVVGIERGGTNLEIPLHPIFDEQLGYPIVGVYPQLEYIKQGILNSIKLGFVQTYQMTLLLLGGLGMLFTGAVAPSQLAGPVGITTMVGEAVQGGMIYLLSFTAFLSINLGIVNLLPIPALDGSRIVFALVEAVRRKPLDPEKEGFIHWLGFVFLMLIIIFATYNDIVRLIKG
ncbi:MAG: RIP metalloprotease RseP [Firmicutes bacterium]|nr:RIP metalloprotease RseP [Bacillota bacterium]